MANEHEHGHHHHEPQFSAAELATLDGMVTREGKFDHHPKAEQRAVAAKVHELAQKSAS